MLMKRSTVNSDSVDSLVTTKPFLETKLISSGTKQYPKSTKDT
jgi:hypothetical protein